VRSAPDDALLAARRRAPIPPIDGRLPLQARIVARQTIRWVEGTAHAWDTGRRHGLVDRHRLSATDRLAERPGR
jgi:hypothetical protein